MTVLRQTPDWVEVRPEVLPWHPCGHCGAHELGGFSRRGAAVQPETAKTIGLTVEPVQLRDVEEVVVSTGVTFPIATVASAGLVVSLAFMSMWANKSAVGQVRAEVVV